MKSVKSLNPCKSLPALKLWQAGVIQTINDIVTKGHGGELLLEIDEHEGTSFLIHLRA